MKVLRTVATMSLSAAVALIVGCSKSEETPSAAPSAPPAAAAPADTAKPAEVQKAAEDVAASASTHASVLIDQAKSFITDQRYTEAADLLKHVSEMKLTPEQQQLVDDLKAQVQKALASGAASDATKSATDAAGGMLGK